MFVLSIWLITPVSFSVALFFYKGLDTSSSSRMSFKWMVSIFTSEWLSFFSWLISNLVSFGICHNGSSWSICSWFMNSLAISSSSCASSSTSKFTSSSTSSPSWCSFLSSSATSGSSFSSNSSFSCLWCYNWLVSNNFETSFSHFLLIYFHWFFRNFLFFLFLLSFCLFLVNNFIIRVILYCSRKSVFNCSHLYNIYILFNNILFL